MCEKKYVFDHVDIFTGEIIKGIAERVENPNIEIPRNKKNFKPLDHYILRIPKELVNEKVNSKVYLSDALLDLGDNCIFEKQVTGCGGTTLALEDNRNCIIAMPLVSSVESKEVVIDPNTNAITYILPGTLCIYSGHNDTYETLKGYIDEHTKTGEPIKIVCTYYQVPKLMNRLRGLNDDGTESDSNRKSMCLNWPEWYYYIDEMQAVSQIYGASYKGESRQERIERRRKIKTMLKYIHYFKHVVFITATPLKEKYFFKEIFDASIPEVQTGNEPLKQLKDFKVVNVIFPKECIATYTVTRHQRKRVSSAVTKKLLPYIKNENYEPNAHVFINSVDGILEILRLLNVVECGNKVRIICSPNEANKEKLQESLKKMIESVQKSRGSMLPFEDFIKINECEELYNNPISTIVEKPKKINFYTSTAFTGSDIFDKYGKTFVVSYGFRANTMYDISTMFLQIAGRIRNTTFFHIDFFFDSVRYDKDNKGDGKSEYERGIETKKGDFVSAQEFREAIFAQRKDIAEAIFENFQTDFLNQIYVTESETGERFTYDELLEDTDAQNADTWKDYKILSNKVIERESNPFLKNGMDFSDDTTDYFREIIEEMALFPEKPQKPKDLLKIYDFLKRKENAGIALDLDEIAAVMIIETKYKYLVLGADNVGIKKMEELGFRKTEIEAAIRRNVVGTFEETETTKKIKKYLSKWVPVGDFMSAKEKKRVAQEATREFNVKIKIEDFFDVVVKATRDKRFSPDGKPKNIPFILGWKHTLFD